MRGAIYNIIIDLRRDSKTFLNWIALSISSDTGMAIHVPAGCANAYLTLEDNTWIHYYHSEFYAPASYRGFRYDDPTLKFEWPTEPAIVSQRDLSFPDFDLDSFQSELD